MSAAITIHSVSKTYGPDRVLNDVSFVCPAGSIIAFVGPNGAGKSTTMRIICRLTRPTSGAVSVDGVPVSQLEDPGAVVGSVLDPSAHHPGRSVWTTIRIPAMMLGLPKSRVSDVIEQMGLASVRRRRFKALSLGMKQRVSLAIALLANPRILVLDEPMNGLDIDGMEWIRSGLRGFADQGGTVLVSSHLLNELQQFADRLVIISQGEIRADDSIDAEGTAAKSRVEAAEPDRLSDMLEQRRIPFTRDGMIFDIDRDRYEVAELAFTSRILLLAIADVSSARSIEQTYHDLTSGDFTMGGTR